MEIQVAFTDALESEGLWERALARQDGRVDLTVDDPSRPDPAGHVGQRGADDVGVDPGVHGAVRHRPALRPPRHPSRPPAWPSRVFWTGTPLTY
jgi:hypothetical protein